MLIKFDTIIEKQENYSKLNYLNSLELNSTLTFALLLTGKYLIINKKALIIIIYILKLLLRSKHSIIKSKSNILNFNLKQKIIIGYKNKQKLNNNFLIKKNIIESILHNKKFNFKVHDKSILLGIDSFINVLELTYEFKLIVVHILSKYPGSSIVIKYKKNSYNKLFLSLSAIQIPFI